jgi:hypothetical protein
VVASVCAKVVNTSAAQQKTAQNWAEVLVDSLLARPIAATNMGNPSEKLYQERRTEFLLVCTKVSHS